MTNNSDKEDLIRQFEELKGLELGAEHLYRDLLPLITDEEDKNKIQSVINDEIEHALMVQKIIDIIKK
jgi:rubrerythrin